MQRVLLAFLLMSSALFAFQLENSPAADALNGLTILSPSLLDSPLCPLIAESGWGLAYQMLHGMPEISVYTAGSAFDLGRFHFSAGSSYLTHTQYRHFQPWLNMAYSPGGAAIGLGLNGHFDSIASGGSQQDFGANLGIRKELWGGALQLDGRQIFSPAAAYGLSLKSPPVKRNSLALACSHGEHGWQIKNALYSELWPALDLAASWQSNPGRFGLGLFVKVRTWKISYALRSHPRLNYTHSVGLESSW